MTILIVEDDEDIRAMLALILDGEGYRVAIAQDGSDALAYLRNHEGVALVLTDIMMPCLDGWELIDAMRADPRLEKIPVVVMTGAITSRHAPACIRVLKKPFPLSTLLEAVGSHIDKQPSRESDPALIRTA